MYKRPYGTGRTQVLARTMVAWLMGVAAFAASGDDADPSDLPWELRDFYEIKTDNGTLTYAVDNGQWGLEISGVGQVIHKATSSITLRNGTTIQTTGVGSGSRTRRSSTPGTWVV